MPSSSPGMLDRLLAAGNYLAAYDLACLRLDENPTDVRAAYSAVLALARTGATEQARRVAARLNLAAVASGADDTRLVRDIGTMQARLEKDDALRATGDERRRRAASAASAYESVSNPGNDAYPLVNAATLWLLAGEAERAETMALRALESLSTADDGGYWDAASAAEASLVRGDLFGARQWLAEADNRSSSDPAARAVTLRQLRLVCEHRGFDVTILAPLRNRTIVHYTGHRFATDHLGGAASADLAERIAAALERHDVGSGHGSLAAGSDIVVAEALLSRGAELHVVLPFAQHEFIEVSVSPAGANWSPRFNECLALATSVTVSADVSYLGEDLLFDLAARVAMGDAVLRSRVLEAPLLQVAVWDGGPARGAAGTALDVARWAEAGLPREVVRLTRERAALSPGAESASTREVRAMIFLDIAGYSSLDDTTIPLFMDVVMRSLGRCLDRFEQAVLVRQTWGDAIYVAMADVSSAAECALALQRTMAELDLAGLGLGSLRGMRLACHVGPVFRGRDHVRDELAFYGSAVVRAARIEPRTPEGEIYVTQQFAALAAWEGSARWDCQYVGLAPTAKSYGDLPMYVLRPR